VISWLNLEDAKILRDPVCSWLIVLVAASLSLAVVWVVEKSDDAPHSVEISYAEFLSLVENDRVVKVRVRGEHVYAVLTQCVALRPDMELSRYVETWVPSNEQKTLLPLLRRHSVIVSTGG